MAFGSSLGLAESVSLGVVSAVARQPQPNGPMIYIQTDASINPGNSGGPLVDVQGRVVGISTFILSQSGGNEGLWFAAPSNIVGNVYEQIRVQGRVRRGELGVWAQTITPELARGLGLAQDWGVVLGDVFPGGPVETAGLRVGDIVQRPRRQGHGERSALSGEPVPAGGWRRGGAGGAAPVGEAHLFRSPGRAAK